MFNAIKNFFNSLLRGLWSVLRVVFSGVTEYVLAQLKDIAINTVRELSESDLSNDAKRKEAFNRIKEYAQGKGIQAKDALINLAIEIAVVYLKKTI